MYHLDIHSVNILLSMLHLRPSFELSNTMKSCLRACNPPPSPPNQAANEKGYYYLQIREARLRVSISHKEVTEEGFKCGPRVPILSLMYLYSSQDHLQIPQDSLLVITTLETSTPALTSLPPLSLSIMLWLASGFSLLALPLAID